MNDSPTRSPAQSAIAAQASSGAVVAAQHGRVVTLSDEAVEFVDQVLAGDRALDQAAEAFTGVLIDDGHDLDRPAVGGGVELEVHSPHHVRRIGLRQVGRGGGAEAFAAAPLRDPQALLTPSRWIFLWFTAQPSPRAS